MFNNLIDRAVYKIFKCVDRANIVCISQSVNLPDVAECIALRTHKFKVNFRKTFSWAEVVCKLPSLFLTFITSNSKVTFTYHRQQISNN